MENKIEISIVPKCSYCKTQHEQIEDCPSREPNCVGCADTGCYRCNSEIKENVDEPKIEQCLNCGNWGKSDLRFCVNCSKDKWGIKK